ncbi:permease [Desulfovibrio sulfodismutans]|uniref:Permease n=1 Tax=Desulfolutivibrio sulfodismutans TaxID=63561 RepID=A0A7K3NJM5_9BACT|nr:permease [Desulfolutivibrio sulfodismutans]NDY55993.1 permease [Desulfolutivibrio sulfodismutans]QLA13233.1 permease [Desulfolutivibrio sulfodismutans DSM 3696]
MFDAPFEGLGFFAMTATAIFLEAAPFLLLGSFLAALIECFVPPERMQRLFPKRAVPGVLAGLFAGLFLPVCECGIVPIVRRMLQKGVPPASAMTYMLAAPIVNPVVMASTYTAFQGDWFMMAARTAMGAVTALGMGLALSRLSAQDILLDPAGHGPACACGCGHDHGPTGATGAGTGDAPACAPVTARARITAVISHTAGEFLDMGGMLILGSLFAAAFKTLTPSTLLTLFETDPLLSIMAMMLLAILLSLCSEADAFVAASFTTFPASAKLAFLALGPMLDIKLAIMFQAVFTRRVVTALLIVPPVMVFVLSYALSLFGP